MPAYDPSQVPEAETELDVRIRNVESFDTSVFETQTQLGLHENDSETIQAYTYNGFQENSLMPVTYCKSYTFQQVVSAATESLGLKYEDYSILLCFSDDDMRWFDHNKYLEDYSVFSGMKFCIFPSEFQIKVESTAFNTNQYIISITDTVEAIVKKIAQVENIENPSDFTLFKEETKTKDGKTKKSLVPLSLFQDLPHQCAEFKSLVFKRRFFIFSAADLVSQSSILIAFDDAFDEIRSNKRIYIQPDVAVELTAYAYVVDHPDVQLDDANPPETKKHRPYAYKSDKSFNKQVNDFLKKNHIPDANNAARLFIRLARTQPGFGVIRFSCFYEIEKVENECQTIISPHDFLIYHEQQNKTYVRIPYHSIVNTTLEEDVVTVNYSLQRNVGNVSIRSKHADEIHDVINSFHSIQRNLLLERARLRLEGKWRGPVSEMDRLKLDTYNGISDKEPVPIEYDKSFTGKMVLQLAMKELRLPVEKIDDYGVLCTIHTQRKWLNSDVTVGQLGIFEGSKLYILTNKAKISIKFGDTDEKLFLDLTAPCKDVVTDIFKQIKQPYVHGYALFVHKNNEMEPLDYKYPIPEQTLHFSTLYLRRRFFMLSKDDFASAQLSKIGYNDSREYFLHAKCEATDKELMELTALSLLIEGKDDACVQAKDFALEKWLPTTFKCKSDFKKNFVKYFPTYPRKDKEINYIRAYLKILRDVPFFGAECQDVKYRIIDTKLKKKGKFLDGEFRYCPLLVYLMDSSGKQVYKIPWTLVIRTKIMKEVIHFTFCDATHHTNKDSVVTLEIRTNDMQRFQTMVDGSLNIYQQMLKERQRELARQRAETAQKLAGGWTDQYGVIHGPMIDLMISQDLAVYKKSKTTFWIDLSANGEELVGQMSKYFQIEQKPTQVYSVVIISPDGSFSWLGPKETLLDVNPTRKSHLVILNTTPLMKITSASNISKTIKLDITQPLKGLLKQIAAKYGISNFLGYTLFTPNTERPEEKLPLELIKSIPEQTYNFDDIVFKRRFYMISRADFLDNRALWQTYSDIVELVLSGSMDLTNEQVAELAYYQLIAEKNEKLEAKNVPEDLNKYVPKGMKLARSMGKDIKGFCKTMPIEDPNDARRKYIALARSIETFGSEIYQVQYYDTVKGKTVLKDCLLYVTPYKIYTCDLQKKEKYMCFEYCNLLDVNQVEDMLSLAHCTNNGERLYDLFKSPQAALIKQIITSYIHIGMEILNNAIAEGLDVEEVATCYRITVLANYVLADNRNVQQSIALDSRLNGKQVSQRVTKLMGLHPRGEYACMLNFTKQDHKWVLDSDLIGNLRPYENISMSVYNRYMKIKISMDGVNYTYPAIDVTKPIKDLIPRLAAHFDIEMPIGYTIFKADTNKPLDLRYTIPEQESIFDSFIFRRYYYMNSKYDMQNDFVVIKMAEDFKAAALSGQGILNESEMLELAVYDIFMHADNPDLVKKMEFTTLDGFLPVGMISKPQYIAKLNNLLATTPAMTAGNAARTYIIQVQKLNGFDRQTYNAKLADPKGDLPVHLSISSTQLKVNFDTASRETISVSMKHVLNVQAIQDELYVRIESDEGESTVLQFHTPDACPIENKIIQLIKVVIPELKIRESIAKVSYYNTKEIPVEQGEIPLIFAGRFNERRPRVIRINPNRTAAQVCDVLQKHFFVKDLGYKIGYFSADFSFRFLEDDVAVRNVITRPDIVLYYMKPQTESYIESAQNFITKHKIHVSDPINTICQTILSQLGLGVEDGYTLYTPDFTPLDLQFSLPYQTDMIWDMYLRRRFYVFTHQFFENPLNITSLYEDCKLAIMSGAIPTSEDLAAYLGIYSVYAQIPNVSDFNPYLEKFGASSILPVQFQNSEVAQKKVDTISHSIVPVNNPDAQAKYIAEVCQLRGFGAEYHDIEFKNAFKDWRPGVLALSPFAMTIESGGKVFDSIDYVKIIQYYPDEEGNMVIRYYNDNNFINFVMIRSPRVNQVFTYINTLSHFMNEYGHLLTIDEIRAILLKLQNNPGGGVENYGFTEDFKPSMFNLDVTDQGLNIDNLSIDDLNLNFLENNADYSTYNVDSNQPANVEFDLVDAPATIMNLYVDPSQFWIASPQGHSVSRSKKAIEAIEKNLKGLIDDFNKLTPTEFNARLNAIDDMLALINPDDLSEEFRNEYLKLKEAIKQLRDLGRMIEQSDQELYRYKDQIQDLINQALASMPTLKSQIDKKIVELAKTSNKNLTPVSRALIALTEQQDNLTLALINDLEKLKGLGFDTRALIRNLENSADALTRLAANFTDSTDPRVLDQLVIPQLEQMDALIKSIADLVLTANLSDKDLDALIRDLTGGTTSISSSLASFSNASKAAQGDLNKTLLNNRKAANAAMLTLIKAKKEIDAQMKMLPADMQKEAKELSDLLARAAIELALNPNSINAPLQALDMLKLLLNKIRTKKQPNLKKLDKSVDGVISDLEAALRAVSFVNIIPANVDKVIDDAMIMIRRFEAINADEWQARDKQSFVTSEKAVADLKADIDAIETHIAALRKNMVNGQAQRLLQVDLLKLANELPKFQTAVDLIYKNTNDGSFPVIIERLITDLDATLYDIPPLEDLDRCQHIEKYHNAMTAVANIINQTNRVMGLEAMKKNPMTLAKLDAILEKVSDLYTALVKDRAELHEHPFDKEAINQALRDLEKTAQTMNLMKLPAAEVTEITRNNELSDAITEAVKSVAAAVSSLKDAPIKLYRLPPTRDQINKLNQALADYIQMMSNLKKQDAIANNKQNAEKVQKEIDYIKQKMAEQKQLKPYDTQQFYHLLEKMYNRIERMPQKLNGLPHVSGPSPSDISRTTLPPLRNLLKAVVPTAEQATKDIIACIEPTEALIKALEALKNDKDIKKDKKALEDLESWIKALKAGDNMLKAVPKTGNTLQSLKALLGQLISLNNDVQSVPSNLRKTIDKDVMAKLLDVLGLANAKISQAVICVRNIPTKGSVNADINLFQRLDQDAELDQSIPEMVQQFNDLSGLIKSISSMPQLGNRPHTKHLIDEMAALLNQLSIDVNAAKVDEKKLLPVLTNSKDRLQTVAGNSELVSSIVGVPKLPDITKNVSSNAQTIARLLEKPHFNAATHKEFTTLILPQLMKLIEALKGPGYTQNANLPALAPLKDLPPTSQAWYDDLKTAKPGQAQRICDDIHSKLNNLIGLVMDYPELNDLANAIFNILDTTGKYTSASQSAGFATQLYPKTRAVAPEVLKQALDAVADFLSGNTTNVPPNVLAALEENIGAIADKAEMMQPFVKMAAQAIAPLLSSGDPLIAARAALLLALTSDNPEVRAAALEELSVRDFVRTANALNNLATEADMVTGAFNEEIEYRLAYLKYAIAIADTKLLVKCGSISAAIILLDPMHNVQQACRLLLQSAERAGLKDFDNLGGANKEYEQWLYESDLALSNMFNGQIDSLLVNLETALSDDQKNLLPKTVNKFIREMVPPLKRKDRLLTIKWSDMADESNKYLAFTKNILPAIKSSGVVSNGREMAIAISDTINKITPAIRMWSAMANKIDEPKFRNQTEADIGNYLYNAPQLIQEATVPQQLALTEGRLETCLHDAIWAHELAKFEPKTKDKVENIERLISSLKQNMSNSPMVTKQMLNMLVDKLKEMLNQIIKSYPIDFSKQVVDDSSRTIDFDLITDKDCLAAAKIIKTELDKSKKVADSTKHIKQEKRKDGVKNIPKSVIDIQSNPTGAPGIAALENLNSETTQQFELQARLAELMQLLLQLYPDLIKFLDNPQQVAAALMQMDEGDIQRTAGEINNMLGLIADPEKFDKYAKNLSQEQVFNELLLLRHMTDSLMNQPVKNSYNTREIVNWIMKNPSSEADPARAFQKMSAVEQLLQTLMALKFSAGTNNPKAAKFARTEEGMNVLRQNIPQHDLIQIQQGIAQQMGFASLPESLKIIQSSMSPEEVLLQARVINLAIDILTKNADKLNPENMTQNEVLKELFQQQLAQSKENPNTFGNNYVDQELTEAALTYIDDTQAKLAVFRAISQLAGPMATVPPKPIESNMKKALDAATNQVNNPSNETPKLSNQEKDAAQYALSVVSSPEFLKFVPPRKETVASSDTTMISSMTNALTPASGTELYLAPASSGINNSFTKNDMVHNALVAATLFNNIKKAINEAKPNVKPQMKAENRAQALEELENFKQTPLKDYSSKVQQLKPDEAAALLALVEGSLASLNDAVTKLNGAGYRDSIFDRACLLAMQQKGTPDPLTAQKIQELQAIAAKRRKEVDLASKIGKLLINRSNVADCTPASTMSNNAKKQSVDEVIKQMEMTLSALSSQLERFNDDELSNQQAVLISAGLLQHEVSVDNIADLAKLAVEQPLQRGSTSRVINSIKYEEQQQNLLEKLINIAKKINDIIKNAKAGSYSIQEYAQAQDTIATMLGISDEQLGDYINRCPKEQLVIIAGQIAEIIGMLNKVEKKAITDFPVAIPDYDLTIRAQNETPSTHQLATAEANLFAAILRLLPSMSMVPVSECKSILATETQSAGVILTRLLNHKGSSYPVDASTLLQVMPQLCAAAIRVVSTLPESARKLIGCTPTDLAIMSARVSTTAASLSDPKASQECYTAIEKLLTAIRALNAICAERGIELKSVDALANVKRSIDTKDIDEITMSLIDTRALNAAAASSNTKDAPLDAVKQQLADVEGPSFELQAKQSPVSAELGKKLESIKPKLIEVITRYSEDPLKEIASIQNIRTARDSLLDKRARFQTGVNGFVRSVTRKDRKLVKNAITDILTTVSTGESMAARSLLVTNANNPGNYSDLVGKFAISVSSLKSIDELGGDSSTNPTAVRRTTRSLNRMIDSLIDMLEDAETPQWTEKPKSAIDLAKLEVLKALTSTIQVLMGAVAAHNSAKIPETFAVSLQKCMPQLTQSLNDLAKRADEIEKPNTDKNAYIAFKGDVGTFTHSINDLTNNLNNISMSGLLSKLLEVASSSRNTLTSLNRLTDVEIEEPDLEAAEMLPQHFTMPPVPSDINATLAEQAQQLTKLANAAIDQEKAFFTAAAAKDNKKTATAMVNYAKAMKAAVEQILRASATTTTLSNQNMLTTGASNIVNSFESLLTALRNRFLLRGDWANTSAEAKQSLENELSTAIKVVKEAVEIARREEAMNDAVTKRLRAALKPLQTAASKVDSQLQAAQERPSSMSREWALQVLSLGSALSKATIKIMLHSKEHPSANSNKHADLGENVIRQLAKISADVEKILAGADEPEGIVIGIMDALAGVCQNVQKGSGIEDQALLEAFNIVLKTSRNVKATAEGIQEQKKAAKARAAAGGGVTSSAKKQSKPQLLKRLDLESRVIRARTILERYEAQLNELQ